MTPTEAARLAELEGIPLESIPITAPRAAPAAAPAAPHSDAVAAAAAAPDAPGTHGALFVTAPRRPLMGPKRREPGADPPLVMAPRARRRGL